MVSDGRWQHPHQPSHRTVEASSEQRAPRRAGGLPLLQQTRRSARSFRASHTSLWRCARSTGRTLTDQHRMSLPASWKPGLGRSQMTTHFRLSHLPAFLTSRALSPSALRGSASAPRTYAWARETGRSAILNPQGVFGADVILGPDSPATTNMGRTDVLACGDVRRPRTSRTRSMHPGGIRCP
jgi:hypothetical protein